MFINDNVTKRRRRKKRKQREVRILKETWISTQFLKSEVLKVNIRYLPGGRSVWEKALLKFKRLKARAALKNNRSDLNWKITYFLASLLFFRFAKNGAGLRGIGNFIFLKFHSSFPSFLRFPLTYQELGKAAKVKLFHHSSHFKGSSSIKL